MRSTILHFQIDPVCLLWQFLPTTVQTFSGKNDYLTNVSTQFSLGLEPANKTVHMFSPSPTWNNRVSITYCQCSRFHQLWKKRRAELSMDHKDKPANTLDLTLHSYTFQQCNYSLRPVIEKMLSYHWGNSTAVVKSSLRGKKKKKGWGRWQITIGGRRHC